MIIKKKYTKYKPIEENQKKDNSLIPEKVSEKEVQVEIEHVEENIATIAEAENPVKEETDILNLNFDDIKFEQRQERREGTRRRGYRRSLDRNIVSRAQKDALAIKEQAKQDGYNEGIKNASADLLEIKNKFTDFFKYKDEVFDKISSCILDISVEIAKKIIIKEIEEDSEYLIKTIKNMVEEINKTENKITLKVMPKDVELVRDRVPEIFSDGAIEAKITVIADNTIKEGGVIIETSNGIINASIDSQLAIIEKALSKKEES